jgi:hypothetical protein
MFIDEISIEQLGVIYNIVDGVSIYNPSDITQSGTISGNILTLTYDTSSMSDSDKLQIFYSQLDEIIPTNNPTKITGDLGIPFIQREDGVLRTDDMSLNRVFGENLLTNLDNRLKVETKNQDQYFVCILQTLNQEFGVDITGQAGATIQLSGTFTGTISFEVTADGGNYIAINGQAVNGVAAVSTATAVGIYRFNVTGLQRIRCRCSAAMTGLALITFRLSSASYDNLIASTVITGTSVVSEATLDTTVLPIAKTWTVAPTAPVVQTTFPHPNSSRYPQILPSVRTQIIGDQQLPYKQQPNTLEQVVKNDDELRMLEKIWLNLALHNQIISATYNIPLPNGWETIQ